MTYANIKLEKHTYFDKVKNARLDYDKQEIHPFMKPFVEALALKYPQWEFVECDSRSRWDADGNSYPEADGFKIMEKREELGRIRVDHWCRTGDRYWIDNFRIDAQKSRGRGFKTKHMDKAMKHVTKFFGSRNTTEIAQAAEERANNVKRSLLSNLQSDCRYKWNRLDDHAADFLMENWAAFESWLTPTVSGSTLESLQQYPEAYKHHMEACKIDNLINQGKAWLVNIVNSDYIMKQGEAVSISSSDQLPAKVRRNLGMLKLVQDREIISNVGIRVSEDTYYVLGEDNE